MISQVHDLNRKIKESNIEEIYKRLYTSKADQVFVEILAEFGAEIANNPIFVPYIKNIGNKENKNRQTPENAAILQKATHTPTGQQILDQKMLIRRERISEYHSLWIILRWNELYDISCHEQMRTELITKNDLRDLADFETGINVISVILEGNSNVNLADYYLPHAHRVMSGIIQFFDKQQLISIETQNLHEKNITQPQKNSPTNYKQEIIITELEKQIQLSFPNNESTYFDQYEIQKQQKGELLRYKLLKILKNCHPKALSKQNLKKELNSENKKINRARRGINERVPQNYKDLITRSYQGSMSFNDKYHIVFK